MATGTLLAVTASCSLSYEVDAFLRDGKVVFRTTAGGYTGGKAASVKNLIVEKISSDRQRVWDIESTEVNGQVTREITYGAVPAGMKEKRRPIPLKVGDVYLVTIFALGGEGSEQFVIVPPPGPERPIKTLQQ